MSFWASVFGCGSIERKKCFSCARVINPDGYPFHLKVRYRNISFPVAGFPDSVMECPELELDVPIEGTERVQLVINGRARDFCPLCLQTMLGGAGGQL